MPPHQSIAIHPYEALVAFVNEKKITVDTWRTVLDRLASWRFPLSPEMAGRKWSHQLQQAAFRFGLRIPEVLKGQRIHGPEPLLKIQQELKEDLARLIDPQQDPIPAFLLRGFPEAIRTHPPKTVEWLQDKINSLSRDYITSLTSLPTDTMVSEPFHGLGMFVMLSANTRLPRVLPTDPVAFVPVFDDLRIWLYWVLANLWVDGLLTRLGRCQTCGNFFLAKTQKTTIFCSQRCGKNATAGARGQRYRQRQGAWENARRVLEEARKQGKRGKALKPVLKKARAAFEQAFQQKVDARYEEARRFLDRIEA